jgi:hypothetical protein
MPTNITINNITGSSPFDVDTVSTLPYSFDVPIILEGLMSYSLKIVDDNNCSITEILTL